MFSVHATSITGHFGLFCVWEKLAQGNHVIIVTLSIVFEKLLNFQNVLHQLNNEKPRPAI